MTPILLRLFALFIKELRAVLGDKQSLRLLIIPVLIQLVLFPFAASMEVRNTTIAVLDLDGGPVAREVLHRLSKTAAFTRILRLNSEAEFAAAIDSQQALMALRFGNNFSQRAQRGVGVGIGVPERIQAIVDGRRPNAGQIAVSYIQDILFEVAGELGLVTPMPAVAVRHWYNPNLNYYHFILPSLVAMVTTLSALVVTALSVAREREQGTLEQLLVSPLTPWMIFAGKTAPALIVSWIQATIVLATSIFAYDVAFQGSFGLLYLLIIPYVFALSGIGLFISTACTTQQQAFLGVFLFMMPAILLSGFVSPTENMPEVLQVLTWANPVRHFLRISQAIYLKDGVLTDFTPNLIALTLIACVTSAASLLFFRRRLA